ncbi:MAG: hypothetical protein R3E95_03790 [Thiolinea sp.]
MNHQESNTRVEEARLLLPWYLTNTLSAEEQQRVNQALESSAELREEFLREEQMMRLVRENTSLLELSALDTTEQRLEKMLGRIEREEQQQQAARIAPQTSPVKPPPQDWFKRFFGKGLFGLDWLTPANAVFASLLVLQAGLLTYAQLQPPGINVLPTSRHRLTHRQPPAVTSILKACS